MRRENGQVALVVVLVLVVMSVVVLSVVARSVTNVRLANIEEQSSRALRAAEAGVERALSAAGLQEVTTGDFGGVTYEVDLVPEGNDGFVSEGEVLVGDVVEVLIEGSTSYPTGLDIFWGDLSSVSEAPTGAVEIIRYQRWAADDYRAEHSTADPDSTRVSTNGFDLATTNPGQFKGVNFAASYSIPINPQDILVRIKVFYNGATVGVRPTPVATATLPDQQYRVVSTGETEDGVVRRVEAVRSVPVLPSVFDAALYSGGSLVQ